MINGPRCGGAVTSAHRCPTPAATAAPPASVPALYCARCPALLSPSHVWRTADGRRRICGACASAEPSDEREVML